MLLLSATSAFAQVVGRVTRDHSIIWHQYGPIVAAVAPIGTSLDINRREGRWYVVVIPRGLGGRGEVGRIAVTQVEVLTGTTITEPPTPVRATPAAQGGVQTREAATDRGVVYLGLGQIAYTRFTAGDTFDALFGTRNSLMYGAGFQLQSPNGVFVQGTVDWFRKTGERVFVADGEVFRLGIPDRVTIIPLAASAGYRFGRARIRPYAGAGAGVYFFRERSDFAADDENVRDRFASYHVLGGVEFRTAAAASMAIEARYTIVPDALGTGGASAALGESDLGGLQVQFRILLGK